MSASQCRCDGPTGDGGVGRSSWRVAIGLLGAIFVLGAGLLHPGRSRAQEAPAKAEAPKGDDSEKAQEETGALSLRYRFVEKYAVEENAAKPELIGVLQVGSREDVKVEVERAEGAPLRNEGTIRAIYTERPAKVTKLGEVTDLVRLYEMYNFGGSFSVKPVDPPLLKDLTIWCRLLKDGPVEMISLTPGRLLREEEFNAINDKMFLPQLSSVLPQQPTRIGDTWKLRPRASRSLLGSSVPDDGEFDVEGALVEVRKAANGSTWTAKIEISGQLTIEKSPAAVLSRILFEFADAKPPEPAEKIKAGTRTGIVEARGHIARVVMTRKLVIPLDENGRLHKIVTRELNVVRRPASNPLKIPDVPPIADKANSWVRYEDPQGQFHFNHPQDLVLEGDEEPGLLQFLNKKPAGTDAMIIIMQDKEADPVRSRELQDPNYHIRNLRATWQKKQQEVVELEPGWLPIDAKIHPNRKVFRFEAGLKRKDPQAPRAYYKYYLILDAKGSFVVTAITERNDEGVFRGQVEDVINSFVFDQKPGAGVPPSRPPANATPARPAPAVPPARPR
jgi:hypothetical protein